jgi:hypothetical protein
MRKLHPSTQMPATPARAIHSCQSMKTSRLLQLAATILVASAAPGTFAQGSAFTYQGRLDAFGSPAHGNFDFSFTLHDAALDGATIGAAVTTSGIGITNGLFTVALDFGANAFNGQARWLNIAVRTNGGASFSPLAPRQLVTPAPCAVHAVSAGVASGLTGSVTVPGTITALGFVGNGAGLTNLGTSSVRLNSLTAADGTPNNAVYVDDAGRVGMGTTQPSVRLSLGNDTSAEKLAIAEGSAGRTTGFGVTNNLFRFHLGEKANWFSFFIDASASTPLLSLSKAGQIENFDNAGNKRVEIGGTANNSRHGSVTVHDSAGVARAGMSVDAAGKGRLVCDYIQINGGADIAEPFEVRHDSTIQPGMVVAIDPERPGELRLATRAYDPTVAGIISGANGILPGLMLQQLGTPATGRHPVALTGRVWCHVDADAGGGILPGDLLTSADEPGHAMKASDRQRAPGAIIGKAMTPLASGKGLVLVLVSLQ